MTLSRVYLALALVATPAVAAERPNVLIILTDDMGFSDLSCYGGESRAPNFDALAAKAPAKVSELAAAWEAWAKKVGVRPWDEIGGKKKK